MEMVAKLNGRPLDWDQEAFGSKSDRQAPQFFILELTNLPRHVNEEDIISFIKSKLSDGLDKSIQKISLMGTVNSN